ncbi:MAG: hypothetical protein ABIJ00_08320 [Candidatus Eisenbacteria bacterium]
MSASEASKTRGRRNSTRMFRTEAAERIVMIRKRVLFSVVLTIALFIGCDSGEGDPEDIVGPDPGYNEPDRSSPTKLVTEYFPWAYTTMDSIAYEAALDEAYVFVPIPGEVDPGDSNQVWGRFEELRIAGIMFNARYNSNGQRLTMINLGMTERLNVVDQTDYPDKPQDEEWRKITVLVDLLVVVEDPSDPEGVVNFIVIANQIFVVRPDPDYVGKWVIYRQIDQEPINKISSDAVTPRPATETSSWSRVKSLFR